LQKEGVGMFLYGILPISLSVIAFFTKDIFLDYAEKIHKGNNFPISREIISKRLMVATIFLFIVGVIGLFRSI
jgi:hypothetical protein